VGFSGGICPEVKCPGKLSANVSRESTLVITHTVHTDRQLSIGCTVKQTQQIDVEQLSMPLHNTGFMYTLITRQLGIRPTL